MIIPDTRPTIEDLMKARGLTEPQKEVIRTGVQKGIDMLPVIRADMTVDDMHNYLEAKLDAENLLEDFPNVTERLDRAGEISHRIREIFAKYPEKELPGMDRNRSR